MSGAIAEAVYVAVTGSFLCIPALTILVDPFTSMSKSGNVQIYSGLETTFLR